MDKITKSFYGKYKNKIKDGKISMYKLYRSGGQISYLIESEEVMEKIEELTTGDVLIIEKIKSYV